MSQEIIKPSDFIKPEAIPHLLPAQISWIVYGKQKDDLVATLTKNELEVQGIVRALQSINVTGLQVAQMQEKLTTIQEKLAEAKQKRDAGQAQRTAFTKKFEDGVKAPMMAYEKRNDEYINTATQWEFQMRNIVVMEQNKIQEASKEEAAYEAHIKSEYFRIGQAYRDELYRLYTDAYKLALNTKEKNILTFKTALIGQLKAVKLVPATQYPRKYTPDTRAMEIIAKVEKYNSAPDLTAAITAMDVLFATYEQDVKNAEQAAAAIEAQQAATVTASAAAVEQDKGINSLVASAGSFQFEGGAKIKKNVVIVEENTDEWMLRIIRAYIDNFSECKKYIRVAERKNIKIEQMAAALGKYATETGLTFDGLELKEVAK